MAESESFSGKDRALIVDVYDVKMQQFSSPRKLENCLLSEIIEPEEVDDLLLVKIDDSILNTSPGDERTTEQRQQQYFSQLQDLPLNDKTEVVAASGSQVFFGTPEIASQVRDRFFGNQIDHCCRYGSLLFSSCNNSLDKIKDNLRVAVVDFESKDSKDRDFARKLETGDCHGKISSNLAKRLGGKSSFQFRMAHLGGENNELPAFLAKGTFLIDDRKTSNQGYDLVLDRSSIKGYNKNTGPLEVKKNNNGDWQLRFKSSIIASQPPDVSAVKWQQQRKEAFALPKTLQQRGIEFDYQKETNGNYTFTLKQPEKEDLDFLAQKYSWGSDRIATGVYDLEDLVLGNRTNAEIQQYNSSWQFNQWFSKEAVTQDILKPSLKEADLLAEIQDDPQLVAQYLVDTYSSKKQNFDLERDEEEKENKIISILEADTSGNMVSHPKIADFLQQSLQKRWQELATKGSVSLEAALAQPAELKSGTIVAPHLKQGEEIIVTRYPIVNKDNIRIYTVDNEQPGAEHLLQHKGCVFIRPDEAMDRHQCDFDGDMLIATPTSQLPNIAREVRGASPKLDRSGVDLNRDYEPVVKRKKQAYQGSLDKVALQIKQNSVGLVANAIGRVYNATADPNMRDRRKESWERLKVKTLNKLFDSLQIEVDSPKSNERHEDVYGSELIEDIKKNKSYQQPFFNYKNHDKLFKTAPFPAATSGRDSVLDMMAQSVSKRWDRSKITARSADNFRYLLSTKDERFASLKEKEKEDLSKQAHQLLDTYAKQIPKILEIEDAVAQKSAFNDFFERLEDNVVALNLSELKERFLASALWEQEHSPSSDKKHAKKVRELTKYDRPKLYSYSKKDHRFLGSLDKKTAQILEVPYQSDLFEQKLGRSDTARVIAEKLTEQNVSFEATQHPSRPMIQFAIEPQNIPPSWKKTIDSVAKEENLAHNKKFDRNHNKALAKTGGISWKEYYDRFGVKLKNNSKQSSDLRFNPPKELQPYLSSHRNKKAALTMALFTDFVAEAVSQKQQQIDKLNVTGIKYNAYQNIDLANDPRYKDRSFTFKVKTDKNPKSATFAQPVIMLGDTNFNRSLPLGVIASNTPQLPNGAIFKAKIQKATTSAVELAVEKVALAQKELPVSPSIEQNKSRVKEIARQYRLNQESLQPSQLSKLPLNEQSVKQPDKIRQRRQPSLKPQQALSLELE